MLINIQFLRFVAAMLVVFFHASAHLQAAGHGLGLAFGFGKSAGFAGVDIFFVISGFIMVWTTQSDAGAANALAFMKRRVARIYSGYWPFYLLALGLFSVIGGHYLANADLLRSALLWPTELQFLLIPVSWTLIFEMVFYLFFALLIALGGRKKPALLVLAMLVVGAWSLYSHFARQAYDPGRLEAMSVYEQYLAFPYLLEFLAGALTAVWLKKSPTGFGWSLLLAGSLLFLAGGWINETQFHGRLIQGYFIIWRVSIFGTASVLILAGLVRLENAGWKSPRRFSLWAGGASYALYLSHTLILAATQRMGLNGFLSQFPAWAAQSAFLLLCALMLFFSMAHYRWLERPLHSLFRRGLKV